MLENLKNKKDRLMAQKIIRLNPISMLYHLIRNDVHKLEYDAETQWKFHRRMSWYWVANFPIVAYMFFWHPKVWIAVGLLLNTFYSLYANFATDYGAVPASYAAMIAKEIQENQTEKEPADVSLSPAAELPHFAID